MAERNFSRSVSIRIPFTANSADVPFDMIAAGIPLNADGTIQEDLSFGFVNETGYDARLVGYASRENFAPVTQASGWSILARSDKGVFLSKKPMVVSVQAFSTPGNPFDPATADFTGCFLELPYGKGR